MCILARQISFGSFFSRWNFLWKYQCLAVNRPEGDVIGKKGGLQCFPRIRVFRGEMGKVWVKDPLLRIGIIPEEKLQKEESVFALKWWPGLKAHLIGQLWQLDGHLGEHYENCFSRVDAMVTHFGQLACHALLMRLFSEFSEFDHAAESPCPLRPPFRTSFSQPFTEDVNRAYCVQSAILDNGNIKINMIILSFRASLVEWNIRSSQCVLMSMTW